MKNVWVDQPARRRLVNKLAWIKRKYGQEAKEYFLSHSSCERCREDRVPALAVHHTHGKKIKKFEVLCHNCHMIHHGGEYTLIDMLNNPKTLKLCLHCK